MGDLFRELSGGESAVIMGWSIHPFYLFAFVTWLVLLALRSLHWHRRPTVHCDTCDHTGPVRNEIRGSWKSEIIRFLIFVPPGFFLHILMGIYLTYFVTRWFVIRRCANCGSERIARVKHAPLSPSRLQWPSMLASFLMLGTSVAIYLFIRAQGEQLPLPSALATMSNRVLTAPSATLTHVLLSLSVIILVARAMGYLFKRLKQPPVMGEIMAGLMLGPSLLGALAPQAYETLLPAATAPYLGILANVGIVLFMFLVGLELNPAQLKGRARAAVLISNAGILLPFVLGSGLAFFLYERYATANASFTVFSLFCGVALSVTAFPVLARVLTDKNLHRTPLGVTALTCASIADVTAWILLAFVSGVATAQTGTVFLSLAFLALYLLAMFYLAKPLLLRLAEKSEKPAGGFSTNVFAVVVVIVLLSALVTEAIGIHALFGAFVVGVFVPHDSRLAGELRARIEDLVTVLFLPAFFAFTGMRTQLGLLSGATDWLFCGLIILAATVGKFGGTAVAARFGGMAWRDSAALGVLMNTRGLMELVVLSVGLDMGILTPALFSMMVLMAVTTTFATSPLLDLFVRHGVTDSAHEPNFGKAS